MSKPRSALYALSVLVLALIATKTKMGQEELILWQGILGYSFVIITAGLATVKTWPWVKAAVEAPAEETSTDE